MNENFLTLSCLIYTVTDKITNSRDHIRQETYACTVVEQQPSENECFHFFRYCQKYDGVKNVLQ